MSETDDIRKHRFVIGIFSSIVFHILLFLIFQYVVHFNFESVKEYRGAITVTLQEILPKEGIKSSNHVTENLLKPAKVKKKQSVTVNKKVKKEVQKKQENLNIISSISEKKKNIENSSISNKAPAEAVKNYNKGTAGEIVSKVKKGEVKTLTEENQTVPVIPQGIEQKKKVEKPIPFKPGVKVEESPFAFNLGELKNKNVQKNQEKSVVKKSTGTVSEKVISSERSVNSRSIIEWEKGAKNRKVLSMGPIPKIPDWIKKEGLKLKVTLIFKVMADGYVTDVKVYKSSGYSDVDATVIESVRRILFEPVNSTKSDTAKITYLIEPK